MITTMLAAFAAATLASASPRRSPIDVQVTARDVAHIEVEMTVDPNALRIEDVNVGGNPFQKIDFGEGMNVNIEDVGLPDLPTIHRLVAVSPLLYYTVDVRVAAPVVYDAITLQPIQQELADRGATARFRMNRSLYETDLEIGSETVLLLDRAILAGVTVLPIKLTPIHYNPALSRLTIWTKVRATIRGDMKAGAVRPGKLLTPYADYRMTPFRAAQVAALVENPKDVGPRHARPGDQLAARLLVLTSADLEPTAREIASLVAATGQEIAMEVMPPGATSAAVRAIADRHYRESNLDDVLIVGDETKVPTYVWNGAIVGDAYYGFLDGDDFYADVALGRVPAATALEAQTYLAKLRRYDELRRAGSVNRDVLLVAHRQLYPEKYTANQERIRTGNAASRFAFSTQYGGAGATNDSVLASLARGPGIVDYRGHGSATAWAGWDSAGTSFDAAEIARLATPADRLGIYFQIACDNGAFHQPTRSYAESMLFMPPSGAGTQQGAVAVYAATYDTAPSINDRLNRNLFDELALASSPRLGDVTQAASNRLVRDSGGSASNNVKTYILFAPPALRPWF